MLTDTESNASASIGHNNPPSDAELLQQYLLDKTPSLRTRFDDLLAAVERAPSICADDDTAGKLADTIKLVTACSKAFETTRVAEKEPYLALGRACDGFFRQYTEKLASAAARLKKPLDVYLQEKAAAERRERERQAQLAREEAQRLADEAEALAQANMPQAADETLESAVIAEQAAGRQEKAAEARPAEMARTRGTYGSMATLRTSWVGEIVDRNALDKAALWPFLSTDVLQKAVNAYVRAGGRDLAGARISEQSTALVR